MKDSSASEIQVLRMFYSISGAAVSTRGVHSANTAKFGKRIDIAEKNGLEHTAKRVRYGPPELLEVGELLGSTLLLEPSQQITVTAHVAIPQESVAHYGQVNFDTYVVVSRGDRLFLDSTPARGTNTPCFFDAEQRWVDRCPVVDWHVIPPSRLWAITRGNQVAESWLGIDDTTGVYATGQCISEDVGQFRRPDNRILCDSQLRKDGLAAYFSLGYNKRETQLSIINQHS
jgi:hypothetical protein